MKNWRRNREKGVTKNDRNKRPVTYIQNADEDHEALKAVTLDIPEGCIYGFVGSNGAGKSTLLRVISGIYRPDSGSVTIDGKAVYDQPQAKENIFLSATKLCSFQGCQ